MVKGISRQIIVAPSPDPKLYDQAIFILREDAAGVSDAMLLKEAKRAARGLRRRNYGLLWAAGGAACTGLVWLLTVLL